MRRNRHRLAFERLEPRCLLTSAPALNSQGSPTLSAVPEDESNGSGTLVAQIIASVAALDMITDTDPDAVEGIAITAADSTNGTWQYSLGGGTWQNLNSPTDAAARLLAADADTRVRLVPSPDFHGLVSPGITFRAWDQTDGTNGAIADTRTNGGTTAFSTAMETASITVLSVNDEPGFTADNPPDVHEDAGPQTLAAWALFSPGKANESDQTATYTVSNISDAAMFAVAPVVASNGTLTYTPAASANGSVSFNVTVRDSGGTANGGDNTSPARTFVLKVNAVNDEPSFSAANPPAVNRDAGLQTLSGWATFSAGPGNEASQTATYTVANISNLALFAAAPTVAPNGTLSYTPASGATGTSTFQVSVQDSGGTANGGDDTSPAQTFTISVNASNSAPVLDISGAMVLSAINEDDTAGSGTLVSALLASTGADRISDADSGATEGIAVTSVDNAHGTWQYSLDGTTWTAFGSPTAANARLLAADAATRVRLVPSADFNGAVATGISFRAWDRTSGANGGVADTSTSGGTTAFSTAIETASITVNAVNDEPTFTAAALPAVNEDAGPQSVAGWATFDAGPADESGQTATYTVGSVSNAALFSTPPAVSANGTLSYTPAANASGTSTFQVSVRDSGGTSNGGDDTSSPQTFTITVNAVNDPPTLAAIADSSPITIGAGSQSVNLSGISAGGGESQVLQVTATSSNPNLIPHPSTSYTSPAATAVLSYTPVAGQSGTAVITVTVADGGQDNSLSTTADNATETRTFTVQVLGDQTLSGFVYIDADNDGAFKAAAGGNAGEPPLPWVTVLLTGVDAAGNPVAQSTKTDDDGSYRFDGLPTGTYELAAVQPQAFEDGKDSHQTAGSTTPSTANDRFSAISVAAGQDTTGYNFGERGLSMEVVSLRLCLSSAPARDDLYRQFLAASEPSAAPPPESVSFSTPDSGGRVTITGTDGDDNVRFVAGSGTTPHRVTANGLERTFGTTEAKSFAFEGGAGNDTVHLEGTDGNDFAELRPGAGELSGGNVASPSYTFGVTAAEAILIDGSGGQDEAEMFDSPSDDVLRAYDKFARLAGAGFANWAFDFEQVQTSSIFGGDDTQDRSTIDYVLEQEGQWIPLS